MTATRSLFKVKFEDYCRPEWGWSKTHSNRLIEAAAVVSEMTPVGVKITTERQARELAKVEAAKRAEFLKKPAC